MTYWPPPRLLQHSSSQNPSPHLSHRLVTSGPFHASPDRVAMDPLSVAASVTALATVATQICSAISQLRSLCKSLPGRLHALNNEVADFELVLTQLALLLEQRRCSLTESNEMAIPHLLRQARMKLNETHEIVKRLVIDCKTSRNTLLGVQAWRKEQERLQMLQDDIRTVKSSLNIMLGASNSQVHLFPISCDTITDLT